ncbi:MAG: CNNM domain-containing protein [Holosporales bacterium]|jgi:Mg2+/Co2+ transporter CorB|nr:CNNM domain-containing protein [Holosporales bacterium]
MLIDILCILIVVSLLIGAAYFAACETAMTAYSKAKIFNLAKNGDKRAEIITSLQPEIGLVISSILTCNTILNSLSISLANTLCVDAFGDAAIFYCPIIISIFIVLFAEVLPKMLTISNPENVLLPSAYFIKYTHLISRPLNKVIGIIAKSLISIIRPSSHGKDIYNSALEELRGVIDLHNGPDVEEANQEKAMLKSVLDLGSVSVSNIMIHRKNVTMLCADDESEMMMEQIIHCPFTRIPIWSGDQDNIIGILHIRDLLQATQAGNAINKDDILGVALKPWFIPENNDLLDQLQAFRSKHEHFAIVVDEYGGFIGIVTLEDIIEEIVGEISDEHDIAQFTSVRQQEDGSYIIDGSINVRDLNREIGSRFRNDVAATLAGLVINSIGIIPKVGQTFLLFGYKFEILRRQRNQITLLKVTRLPEDEWGVDVEEE